MTQALQAIARACPCCGAPAAPPPTYASEPKAEGSLAGLSEGNWAGFFRSKVFFSYARCASCGLLYCPTYFDERSLARLYGWMGDNTAGVPVEALRRTQAGYFEFVKSRDCAGDYLEIGPDIGLFTSLAARHDPAKRFFLFEPNKAVWPSLKAACEGVREVSLHDTMSDLDAVADESLGLAVMIHVLDHLLNPTAYLAALRRKLRPGGTLLLVTHNERSLLARTFGGRYPIFCLQHPQLFNPRTIGGTIEAAGLTPLKVARTRNHFPAGYLLSHLLYQLGIKTDGRLSLPWIAGLPLGNIAAVAVRPS